MLVKELYRGMEAMRTECKALTCSQFVISTFLSNGSSVTVAIVRGLESCNQNGQSVFVPSQICIPQCKVECLYREFDCYIRLGPQVPSLPSVTLPVYSITANKEIQAQDKSAVALVFMRSHERTYQPTHAGDLPRGDHLVALEYQVYSHPRFWSVIDRRNGAISKRVAGEVEVNVSPRSAYQIRGTLFTFLSSVEIDCSHVGVVTSSNVRSENFKMLEQLLMEGSERKHLR